MQNDSVSVYYCMMINDASLKVVKVEIIILIAYLRIVFIL